VVLSKQSLTTVMSKSTTGSNTCCNYVPYNNSRGACCNNQIYNGANDCCAGVGYNRTKQLCCASPFSEFQVVDNPEGKLKCCGFSLRRDYSGVVANPDGKHLCCGASTFNPDTQACCGATAVDKLSKNYKCCGQTAYDPLGLYCRRLLSYEQR